ncbi:MAG: hypothetical protein WC497_03140 [Patescibacteria group bacterium]
MGSVTVVGSSTIGRRTARILAEFREGFGLENVFLVKRAGDKGKITHRSVLHELVAGGVRLATWPDMIPAFESQRFKPMGVEDAIGGSTVIIDCTDNALALQEELYRKYDDGTRRFIAQGAEHGFGKITCLGVDDDQSLAEVWLQNASCNDHSAVTAIRILQKAGADLVLVVAGFNRRDTDRGNPKVCTGPSFSDFDDDEYGTHHGGDVGRLLPGLRIVTDAMKLPVQGMHSPHLWAIGREEKPLTKAQILEAMEAYQLASITDEKCMAPIDQWGCEHGLLGGVFALAVFVRGQVKVFDTPLGHLYHLGWFTPQVVNVTPTNVIRTLQWMHRVDLAEATRLFQPVEERYFRRHIDV